MPRNGRRPGSSVRRPPPAGTCTACSCRSRNGCSTPIPGEGSGRSASRSGTSSAASARTRRETPTCWTTDSTRTTRLARSACPSPSGTTLPDEATTEAAGSLDDLRARLDAILDLSVERLAGDPGRSPGHPDSLVGLPGLARLPVRSLGVAHPGAHDPGREDARDDRLHTRTNPPCSRETCSRRTAVPRRSCSDAQGVDAAVRPDRPGSRRGQAGGPIGEGSRGGLSRCSDAIGTTAGTFDRHDRGSSGGLRDRHRGGRRIPDRAGARAPRGVPTRWAGSIPDDTHGPCASRPQPRPGCSRRSR